MDELNSLIRNSQIFIAVTRDVFGDDFKGEKTFLEKIWDVVWKPDLSKMRSV